MRRRTRRTKREKKEGLDLDINSLLDILVILLVFLLKSYNASDLTVDLEDKIALPNSFSEQLGAFAVTLQVNKQGKIWVNNKPLAEENSLASENIDSDGRITSLYQRLEQVQVEMKDQPEKSRKMINLVMDQELDYENIKKIMHTSGLLGYGQFKFIVQANH